MLTVDLFTNPSILLALVHTADIWWFHLRSVVMKTPGSFWAVRLLMIEVLVGSLLVRW